MTYRPMYETEEDLKNEREIATRLAAKLECNFWKLPYKYFADYIFTDVEPVTGFAYKPHTLIEIKIRDKSFNDFKDGYLISVQKLKDCVAYAKLMKIPFYLVLSCNDFNVSCKIDEELNYPVKIIDMTNYRNDPGDTEPLFCIPVQNFTILDI